jgi:hypothetical protein
MDTDPAVRRPWMRLRALGGVTAVAVGLGLVLLVMALGHCSSFGGTCPSEPVPLLEDDVFGSAAAGGFIAVALPMWFWKPTWRRLRVALAVGLVVGVLIGLIARDAVGG